MRILTLGTRVAVLVTGAALIGGTAFATSASATTATPHKHVQHWAQVTPSGTNIIQDIGLAQGSGGVVNVLWTSGGTSAGHAAINDTEVSQAGRVGHPVTVISGQYLLTDPDATTTAGHVDAIWNGIANSDGSPSGSFVATRAAGGGSWSAPLNVPPLTAIPITSGSVGTTTGANGTPWVAFSGTDSLTVDHVGFPEQELPPSACCVYNSALAVDGRSGATYLAYSSLITHHEGIFVQRLNQNGTADGRTALVPGSQAHGNTQVLEQRVGITSLGHGRGGVYLAYESGYPFAVRIDLLKVGSSRPATVATTNDEHEFAGATATASPQGRLWVAWIEGDGSPAALFVRMLGGTIKGESAIEQIGLPSGTSVVYKVYISALSHQLDVFALLTRHGRTAYWVTEVPNPRL